MDDAQTATPTDPGDMPPQSTPASADSGVTGAIWGDFAIERRIGRGGMGAVYLARQAGLDRKVALKVLPAKLGESEAYRQRFAAEAKAAGRISSPHVVAVHACGEHAGRLWYAMEFVEGQDLAVRLKDGWHPDWREALCLGAQAARGLAAAHRLGMVHRDIKPANLILARDGTLKVADFGLVRNRHDEATSAGQVSGTWTYMAPEQARGEACDHRADLYALGCVLYELLCSRPPFVSDSMANLMYQHLHADALAPTSHAPWLSPAVDELVLRLLAKDPAARPGDAARLAADLDRLSTAMPTGRGRSTLWIVAAVAACLLAGGGWWMSQHPSKPKEPVVPAPAVVKPLPLPAPPVQVVEPPSEPEPMVWREPEAVPPPVPVRDIAKLERDAAALIAGGEHLGPASDLRLHLGEPTAIERQGDRELWEYGRFTFVIEDGLVLNVHQH